MPASTPGGGGSPRRRKRRSAPSKQHLARVQARTYGSQAKQISTQARRQRRAASRPAPSVSRRPVAFRPIARNQAPFKVQRQRINRKASRADKRIPDSSAVPHVPLLRHYTPTQRRVVRTIYNRAAKRAGVRGIRGLYDIASTSQKRQLQLVKTRVDEDAYRDSGYRSRPVSVARPGPAIKGLDLARTKTAGFFGDAGVDLRLPNNGSFANAETLVKPLEAVPVGIYNIGRATVEDPAAVARSSLRTAKESIAGIPQGVKMLVEDPKAALKAMGEDYERRYGSILSNPRKFREMVKNDYGLTPYVLDATALAGGAGQAAGAVSRSSTFGRLADLPGAAGRAARVLHEATKASHERPRLRFSAGEEGTRAQGVSKNLFVALGQRRLDRRRAASYSRRIRKAGFIEEPHGRLLRAPGREALPDRIPALRPGRGEVVGRGLRDVGRLKGLTGRVARDIGSTKSTTRLRMLTHRGRVVREINKHIDKLTDAEKIGTALMLKYGLRSGRESLATIRKRLEQISTREARRARSEGGFSNAEVEALQRIIDNPEKYLTPRAKASANALKDIQLREVAKDPSLSPEVELNRRIAQQAELLDVPKKLNNGEAAPDVGELERLKAMLEDSAEQQRKTGLYKFGQANEVHVQRMANDLGRMIEKLKAGEDADLTPRGGRRADVSGVPLGRAVAKSEMAKHGIPEEASFHQRVQRAAREAKLDEPAYWMSHAEQASGARLRAAGSGLKATERNREYTGSLYRIGAEDVGLDTFVQGVERNIKRRFQWQMVARNIETHAYEWSRNKGQGMTFSQITNELRKRRIDPDSIDLIPATIVRRRDVSEAGLMRGKPTDVIPEGEEFPDAHQAIKQRKTWQELSQDEVQSAPMFRFFAVPKEVGDQLEAATKPSGGFARSMEIILKQKPTRIMLGALNVPWLGFQIASNAALTGLGGGLKPWDIYGAHKWFRGLDHEAREAVEAELGITHGHHFALDQPHLGDTAGKAPFGVRHVMAFYRGYKRTKVGRGLHKANPLDAMFKADEAQNNFFRKVLFYNNAKRGLYRKMGNEWKAIDKSQQSLIDRVFKQPPADMLEAYVKNADRFEQHAKHVRDWLGDYTRFSNQERKVLSANVLFYGYLRFSLRFAFYTMPIQHPIMADILSNIGRLGAQDVKRLFGVPGNYSLSTSMIAQSYFGTPQDAKRGKLESLNFGRMNPFLNAVTQMESLRQSAGLVSPLYQALLDQAFEESSFTGSDWRINGQPTPGEAERPRSYFGSPLSLLNPGSYAIPGISEGKPRNRILQEQLLSMAFPYRLAEQTGIPGTSIGPLAPSQSDDALLWSPREMRYKDETAKAGVRRSRREQGRLGIEDLLLQGLALQPKQTAAPAVVQREREKEADQRNRSMGRRKSRRKTSRGYGGSSSRYGGSSNRYGG